MINLFEAVSRELNLKLTQVENTVKLLDEGATVPFISRYRKEVTGNLDENQIGDILNLGDRAHGAVALTGTATHASVADDIGHWIHLQTLKLKLLYHNFLKMQC